MPNLCNVCEEKVSLMTMAGVCHGFYCGTCGYKSDEEVRKLVGPAKAETPKK